MNSYFYFIQYLLYILEVRSHLSCPFFPLSKYNFTLNVFLFKSSLLYVFSVLYFTIVSYKIPKKIIESEFSNCMKTY